MISLASRKWDLVHTVNIPASEGIFSGDAWEFQSNSSGINRITVWRPYDNSYLVSVYMPIIFSENEAQALLPKTMTLFEACPKGWMSNPNTPATEWVGKAYDTKDCYLWLEKILSNCIERASTVANKILVEMKIRYKL